MSEPVSLPVVTLKPRRALPFFSRHPWVFAGAVKAVTGSPEVGTEVLVRSHEGQFVAQGLYNPNSNIRVRLYSWKESEALDRSFWQTRVESAVRLRQKLFQDTPTSQACRVIYSESDGLSGMTVDRYDDWLVLQWTSAALARRREELLEILQQAISPRGIWLRTERGIGELEGLTLEDGLIAGEPPPRPLFIKENGLQFGVDLQEGQKTGFYFDQRENRSALTRYLHGGRVLDVCCYTGGFALTAASSGKCRHVTAIDSSQAALDMARHNAELNGLADRITFENSDAFEALEQLAADKARFDAVILDPPKLARTRGGLERALKAYIRLNRLALEVLNPDGILLTCSCSGHVSREDFQQVLARAALESGRTLQILEERGQAPDHPVSVHCLETAYLKCSLCRVI